MKNVIKKSLVIIVLFLGLTASAAKKVNVTVLENTSSIEVRLQGIAKGERLFIKSFAGELIFNKRFGLTESFEKKFNLEGMNNGVYFVEVESENMFQITPILKNDTGIQMLEKAALSFFKPQFLQNGDLFKISLMNSNERPVSIAIYTESGTQISKEEGLTDLVIKKDFDISNLPRGIYTAVVTNGRRNFTEDFKVL